ncbi:hypothetical protein COB11_03010 [Candidatus Aerophobetes bacterium]|uniref:Uncharacterized protein n=1 Tax=Aerophobetes bacterium TaxID=2030807 RepID=A0A2A4YJS7_UNCAE|nr:MAG: hypothetical protein COB11_03010 [Candidatus Aerophobetes bacterium]
MYKCSLSTKQYFYFRKKGYILFEDVLKESSQKDLSKNAASILSERNIWKKYPSFKKFCLNRNLTSFACVLANTSFLRLGFDHLFTKRKDLATLFKEEKLLSDVSSIQSLSTSVLVNLSNTSFLFTMIIEYYKDKKEDEYERELIRNEVEVELNPRSALFFDPTRIRFIFDGENDKASLYLISYSQKSSRYILCEDDPYTHDIKREGAGFGDSLRDALHPLFECKTSL